MRGVIAVLMLAVCAVTAAAEQQVRVFPLRFRAARDAALLVEPMLSADGSVLLQPKLNAVTVRDSGEVLRAVAEALTAWDVAPSNYSVRVRVLLASSSPAPQGPPGPLISGVGKELQKVFNFTSYRELDTLQVTAADGSPVEATLAARYHVRFTLRAVAADPDRVQLVGLELARRAKGEEGVETLRPVLRTNVSLRTGQTFVLGAARSEEANQALVLVLWAQREEVR